MRERGEEKEKDNGKGKKGRGKQYIAQERKIPARV